MAKLSKKPRHWIALAIAVVVLIVAMVDLLSPGISRWTTIGTTVMMSMLILNLVLDQKEKDSQ